MTTSPPTPPRSEPEPGAEPPAYDWPHALHRLRGAYADSTLAGCFVQFSHFEAWCRETGHRALPTDPETVIAYIEPLYERFSVRTVAIALYSIRKVALGLRLPDPTLHPDVRLAVRRGRRLHGVPARQATPLTAKIRDRLRATCPDDLFGLRDRAILALGYDTLCRRSELLRLKIEDLEPLPDGSARIKMRDEKTSADMPENVAYLSARGLADVRAWLAAAGLERGPILRRLLRGQIVGGEIQTLRFVTMRLRMMAEAAGYTPAEAARFTSHSLRVGAVQDLTRAGFSVMQIMRAGRWRHVDQVAYYARHTPVNVFEQEDGDSFPIAHRIQTWKRRAFARRKRRRRNGLDKVEGVLSRRARGLE